MIIFLSTSETSTRQEMPVAGSSARTSSEAIRMEPLGRPSSLRGTGQNGNANKRLTGTTSGQFKFKSHLYFKTFYFRKLFSLMHLLCRFSRQILFSVFRYFQMFTTYLLDQLIAYRSQVN